MTSIASLLLIVVLAAMIGTSQAQVVVIANKEDEVTDISKDQLKSIYLGEQQQWKQGGKIALTDRRDNDAIAIKFYEAFLGQSQRKVRKLWLRKVLKGEITPPESFGSDEGIIKFVSENRGAIGFISSKSLNNSVKALSLNGKNPENSAYELQ